MGKEGGLSFVHGNDKGQELPLSPREIHVRKGGGGGEERIGGEKGS